MNAKRCTSDHNYLEPYFVVKMPIFFGYDMKSCSGVSGAV